MTQVGLPRTPMSVLPPRLRIPLSQKAAWGAVFAAGVGLLLLGIITPRVVAELGGSCVALAFAWALAARTGGPKLLVVGLAAGFAVIAIASDLVALRTGASIATAAGAAILGIVLTRPAATTFGALKETTLP